jgi:aminopeptidase YwaD
VGELSARGPIARYAAALAGAALIAASVPPDEAEAVAPYPAALKLAKKIGSRAAATRGEKRAHDFVAAQFRAAGLAVTIEPFPVPGRGRSRNVVGALETPAECLEVLMAHADSVPPGLGANDNATGVGVLVALAPRLAGLRPNCDLWLVATGAEERVVTGRPNHLGATALVNQIQARGRAKDLRYALSVDMVGRGRRFYLRSPQGGPRQGVEGEILSAARRAGVRLRWSRDSGQGNSDHREFELAGLPGAVIEVWRGRDACHHERCDRPGRIQKRSLRLVLGVVEELVRT